MEQSRYETTTDARGRVATVAVETLGTAVGTVSYDYAPNGQIAGVSVAGGMTTPSGFEYHRSAGRITEIVQTGTSDVLAAFSAPDPMGRATQIDLPTATVTLSWDTMGRISALGVDNGTDELERAYVYDGRGRLASLQRTLNGTPERTEEYAYAEPGWLVGETKWSGVIGSEEVLEYVHDAAGNRTERNNLTDLTSTTYAYGDGNRLAEVDSVAVTWDAYGGMTEDHRGWGLIRGPDGAELALEDPSNVGVYELVRDALGRQVAVLDADASFTVWGNPEADLPMVTLDEGGATVLNVAADGLLLGQLRDDVATEAVSDFAGSLIAFDGELLELPGAFGDDATALTTGTGTERHVYAGLAMLPEAPYQLARQRLYDPELGRFASMDPIGLEGGDHRFNYGNGDPVGWRDPEGFSAISTMGMTSVREGMPGDRSSTPASEWQCDSGGHCQPVLHAAAADSFGSDRATKRVARDMCAVNPNASTSCGTILAESAEDAEASRAALTSKQKPKTATAPAPETPEAPDPDAEGEAALGDEAKEPGSGVSGDPTPGAHGGDRGGWSQGGLFGALGAGLQAGGAVGAEYLRDSLYEPASLAMDVVIKMSPADQRVNRMMRESFTTLNEGAKVDLQEYYNVAYRRAPYVAAGVAAGVTGAAVIIDGLLPGPGGEGKVAAAGVREGLEHADDVVRGASAGGIAVFKWRPRGGFNHVTVEILDARGKSLGEFHQFIDGSATGVERVGSDVAKARGNPLSVQLSDAPGAVSEAQRLIDWGDLGQWDRATNSCIHTVCNIANAGGARLPTNPTAQTAYMYRNLIPGE